MIRYELTNTTHHPIPEKAIQHGLLAAEKKLGSLGDRTVSIEVVTSEESAHANKAFRNQDKPTDIISVSVRPEKVGEQVITESPEGALDFDLTEEHSLKNTWPVIGQLIVCYDVIAQNAKTAGQPVERELEWVIEHGILHLMGFHHEHDD